MGIGYTADLHYFVQVEFFSQLFYYFTGIFITEIEFFSLYCNRIKWIVAYASLKFTKRNISIVVIGFVMIVLVFVGHLFRKNCGALCAGLNSI